GSVRWMQVFMPLGFNNPLVTRFSYFCTDCTHDFHGTVSILTLQREVYFSPSFCKCSKHERPVGDRLVAGNSQCSFKSTVQKLFHRLSFRSFMNFVSFFPSICVKRARPASSKTIYPTRPLV